MKVVVVVFCTYNLSAKHHATHTWKRVVYTIFMKLPCVPLVNFKMCNLLFFFLIGFWIKLARIYYLGEHQSGHDKNTLEGKNTDTQHTTRFFLILSNNLILKRGVRASIWMWNCCLKWMYKIYNTQTVKRLFNFISIDHLSYLVTHICVVHMCCVHNMLVAFCKRITLFTIYLDAMHLHSCQSCAHHFFFMHVRI